MPLVKRGAERCADVRFKLLLVLMIFIKCSIILVLTGKASQEKEKVSFMKITLGQS